VDVSSAPSKKLKVSASFRTTRFQNSVSSARLGSGLSGNEENTGARFGKYDAAREDPT